MDVDYNPLIFSIIWIVGIVIIFTFGNLAEDTPENPNTAEFIWIFKWAIAIGWTVLVVSFANNL